MTRRKQDGDAHTASDNKHTKLSSNATSSQHGVVMKIEVEVLMAANADVLCIRALLERSCKYTWKTRLMAASVDESHTVTHVRDPHVCQRTCTLQMLTAERRRRQSRLPAMTRGVQQQDAKSMCTHRRRQVYLDECCSHTTRF